MEQTLTYLRSIKSAQNQFLQLFKMDEEALKEELKEGLSGYKAVVSPKFLYDKLGSKLFESICELPEYYPTRTEAEIFDRYKDEIAQAIGHQSTLIDLGAGNCAKAASLFPVLKPRRYVPVDISVEFLKDAVDSLSSKFPDIEMMGIGLDFSKNLSLPDEARGKNPLFFYPGSSIGNFDPDEALEFLKAVREACHFSGGLLIGVDLIKEKNLLDKAYDDELGVTAAFNKNLLRNVNRMIQADFDLSIWQHRGFYNASLNRVEMHLECTKSHRVSWPGGSRMFHAEERIHTESSYKYTKDDFLKILALAGFTDVQIWTDPQSWFMVCHAKVELHS